MEFKKSVVFLLVLALFVSPVFAGGQKDAAEKEEKAGEPTKVTFFHYFSGTLAGGVDQMVEAFNEENPEYNLVATPVDHEAFKTSIRVMLAGGNPPDLFSYWAGARTKFLVDNDLLEPIDDVYKEADLNDKFTEAVQQAAEYNGKKYFIPLTQHYAAVFYNKQVFKDAGVSPPKTWNEFLEVCEKLKEHGVKPIALGSRERWPAQFWFDYPLLRTAGPEYREKLMNGEASYTDKEVVRAWEIWKDLMDKGYFIDNPNAYDWAEAATFVGQGEAAMNLMGTWFMQLDKDIGWTPGEDYGFFPFPVIDEGVADAAVGPMDGVIVPKEAQQIEAAKQVMARLGDREAQESFNTGTGAIAPNKEVPDTVYNELQLEVKQLISTIPNWAFNYDLATPPPAADVGLNAFSEFIDNPDNYMEILEKTERDVQKAFEEMESQKQ